MIIYALALGAQDLNIKKDNNQFSVLAAFYQAMDELRVNGSFHALANIDYTLINEAVEICSPLMREENWSNIDDIILNSLNQNSK